MKTMLLGATAALTAGVIIGIVIVSQVRKRRSEQALRKTEDNRSEAKAPAEPPPTEEQKLLTLLQAQRADFAEAEYQEDCATFFRNMSNGIQQIFAAERVFRHSGLSLCRRCVIAGENFDLFYHMDNVPVRKDPPPIDSALEAADADTLRKTIAREKLQHSGTCYPLPWDTIMEAMLPCIRQLLRAAEAEQSEICLEKIEELRSLLAAEDIYILYYSDEVVQTHPELKWDFKSTKGYSVPVLYHCINGKYARMSEIGHTGNEAK